MTNKNCCDGQMFGPRYHGWCDGDLSIFKNIEKYILILILNGALLI